MCRWCYLADSDLVIRPVVSKYNGRFLNEEIAVKRGEGVFNAIRRNVADPFEQRAVYNHFFFEQLPSTSAEAKPDHLRSQHKLKSGIASGFFEFENALDFLTVHNPTRMKAIEQLELNYHKGIQQVKLGRVSAVSALQTRQALEMDMLTAHGGHDKHELEAMVIQHVTEMDAVVAHWDKELASLHRRQLAEYKELVMELFYSELASHTGGITGGSTGGSTGWYRRPEIPGLKWLSLVPVSVSTCEAFRTRLVRCTFMEGCDFLSSVISPVLVGEAESHLDPEELIAAAPRKVKSAILLGCHLGLQFRSNQDATLLRVIDVVAPSDCRWPSLREQVSCLQAELPAGLSVGEFFFSRHSNLANGVVAIFHLTSDAGIGAVLQHCDSMHIERLFLPHALVPDLLAPGASQELSDLSAITISALRRLTNVVADPGLKELVFVSPPNLGTNLP